MNDTAYEIPAPRASLSGRNDGKGQAEAYAREDEERRPAACVRGDGEGRPATRVQGDGNERAASCVGDDGAERTAVAAAPRIAKRLAAWWEANARDLPWRFGRATPWGVLVSEVMSQQTQMSRVVPYWQAWMELWPDASALAGASTAEVITMWGRLGYPRRALRLQECAQAVSERYADELPRTYERLVALPGIGDYTASAVMSFAYGKRVAVIDTNIRRVLSRVFLGKESMGGAASAAERALANTVLPQDPSASVMWNQAVMELGAVVCAAKKPLCERCPIAGECLFLESGLPGLGEKRTRPRQRFQGTDRQVRGIVLNALRGLSSEHASSQPRTTAAASRAHAAAPRSLPREQVESLWKDHVQLDSCIASLDEDGLIEILPDGSLRLPR
ncbi:A/G-specific adenine glycosylase [Bifidobacterium lemurum]|nr:A/G-specific adenine glycosylase [Bifidobacterium lemurum]